MTTEMMDALNGIDTSSPKKERCLVDTACYLVYYYAKKDSSTVSACITEYKKITHETLKKGCATWKKILSDYGVDVSSINGENGNKQAAIKALIAATTVTEKNTDKVSISFYPEMQHMDMVISNADNNISTRTLERTREKAHEVNDLINTLKNKVTACINKADKTETNSSKSSKKSEPAKKKNNTLTVPGIKITNPRDSSVDSHRSNRSNKRMRTDLDSDFSDDDQLPRSDAGGTFVDVVSGRQKRKRKRLKMLRTTRKRDLL